jgi:hypothetical protein
MRVIGADNAPTTEYHLKRENWMEIDADGVPELECQRKAVSRLDESEKLRDPAEAAAAGRQDGHSTALKYV